MILINWMIDTNKDAATDGEANVSRDEDGDGDGDRNEDLLTSLNN